MQRNDNTVPGTGDLKRDLAAGKRVLVRRGATCSSVRAVDGAESRTLRFVCSTDGVKRDGNRVRNEDGSWDFVNFAKNPVMLWAHDYGGMLGGAPEPPIGKWSNWQITAVDGGKALVMDATFARHDFADLIFKLYLPEDQGGDGVLRAVSIGWTPLEWSEITDENGRTVGLDFTRNELLECSAVPIPADPDAVLTQKTIAQACRSGIIPEGYVGRFALNTKRLDSGVYVLDSRSPVRLDPGAIDAPPAPANEPPAATDPADATASDPVQPITDAAAKLGGALSGLDGLDLGDGSDASKAAVGALVEASEDITEAVTALVERYGLTIADDTDPADESTEDPGQEVAQATPHELTAPLAALEAAITAQLGRLATVEARLEALGADPEERVGKKISVARKAKLADAHRCVGDGMKLIREVLDEEPDDGAASAAPVQSGEPSLEDELTQRLERLAGAVNPGVPDLDAGADYASVVMALARVGDTLTEKLKPKA